MQVRPVGLLVLLTLGLAVIPLSAKPPEVKPMPKTGGEADAQDWCVHAWSTSRFAGLERASALPARAAPPWRIGGPECDGRVPLGPRGSVSMTGETTSSTS